MFYSGPAHPLLPVGVVLDLVRTCSGLDPVENWENLVPREGN